LRGRKEIGSEEDDLEEGGRELVRRRMEKERERKVVRRRIERKEGER